MTTVSTREVAVGEGRRDIQGGRTEGHRWLKGVVTKVGGEHSRLLHLGVWGCLPLSGGGVENQMV